MKFCEKLVVGNARRRGEASLLKNAAADFLRRRPGRGQPAQIFRDIDISLVEGERLDQRRVIGENRMNWRETAR